MLKAYFDASGHVNAPKDRFVTLAGLMGAADVWESFETAWSSVLEQHSAPTSDHGSRYFHGKEFFSGNSGFHGWTRERLDLLEVALAGVIYDHSLKSNAPNTESLRSVTCTVSKDAYERVASVCPHLPTISQICLNDCIDITINHPAATTGMELFFDQGSDRSEPYFRDLDALLHKKSRNRPPWANAVVFRGKVRSSKDVSAMQAVDMFAWAANRYFTDRPDDSFVWRLYGLAVASSLFHSFYDEVGIRSVYDSNGDRILGANAPAPPIRTGLEILPDLAYNRRSV